MALLLVLLKFVAAPMGLRVSIGRVSMIPLIVSAGPTITLSPSMPVKLIFFNPSSMSSAILAILATLCFGTGGAFAFGTSSSHVVMFSVLFDSNADKFELFDRFTRLDAPVTFWICGFSCRFTTELSATFGDALRGGNGGAVNVWFAFVVSVGVAAGTFPIVLFIICGNCGWACVTWFWAIDGYGL